MNNIVITSGEKYIDIDAYASCIAYAILLKSIDISARAVTTAPLNKSIPDLIRKINLSFDNYIPTDNDEFIILDVSNPNMFDSMVKLENIIEVIDHHTGYEDFWKEKELHKEIKKAEIDFVGAVCTNIYEKFVKLHKTDLLTEDLCKLLTAGILDNTLNLKAIITTERDKKAYNKLLKLGNLDENWAKEYFSACEEGILKDLKSAIINDIKNAKENKNLPDVFGQLTIFNSKKILEQAELIKKIFSGYDEWMINIISLEDGKSYIITDSEKTKLNLENLFNLKFDGDILILDKFMLRKEIIKKAQDII